MIHQFIAAEPKRQKKGVGSLDANGNIITSGGGGGGGTKDSTRGARRIAPWVMQRSKSELQDKLQKISDLRNKTFKLLDDAPDQRQKIEKILQTLDEYERLLNTNLRILVNANSASDLDKFDVDINNKIDLGTIETDLGTIETDNIQSVTDVDDFDGGGGSSKIPSSLITALSNKQKQNIKSLNIELDNLDSTDFPSYMDSNVKELIDEINRLLQLCLSNQQIIKKAGIQSDLTKIVDIRAMIIQIRNAISTIISHQDKKNPSTSLSGGGGSGGGTGSQSPQGSSKMPSSPSAAPPSAAPPSAAPPSAAPPSNVWEYRDNDNQYKPYGDKACVTINDQVKKDNYGQFAKKFTVSSDSHTFDVILIDENEGKQSGALNTRHIRRQGVLKQQSTTSVSPSASMSPSASSPGSYSGNAVQDFQRKPWTNSLNPSNSTRAEWFAATCLKNDIPGNWEWDPPYEMTQNSPRDFSDRDKSKLEEDPIDLWEYRGKNAMEHRSNGQGRDLEFIGFFRFTGKRCGRAPNDLVDHTLKNVKKLRKTYGDIKMNVLYHATNKNTLANLILPTKFIGEFSKTAVYGKGTYFAMGPHIDYTFGNNVYGNVYAAWGSNNMDGYAYVVVSHAATRPSLMSDSSTMINGLMGYNSKTYITGGSLGDITSNPLPLRNREIVYGDLYDKYDLKYGCPVDDLLFVVGVAVFKL